MSCLEGVGILLRVGYLLVQDEIQVGPEPSGLQEYSCQWSPSALCAAVVGGNLPGLDSSMMCAPSPIFCCAENALLLLSIRCTLRHPCTQASTAAAYESVCVCVHAHVPVSADAVQGRRHMPDQLSAAFSPDHAQAARRLAYPLEMGQAYMHTALRGFWTEHCGWSSTTGRYFLAAECVPGQHVAALAQPACASPMSTAHSSQCSRLAQQRYAVL